jgi:hypothetical protein
MNILIFTGLSGECEEEIRGRGWSSFSEYFLTAKTQRNEGRKGF